MKQEGKFRGKVLKSPTIKWEAESSHWNDKQYTNKIKQKDSLVSERTTANQKKPVDICIYNINS